MSQCPRCPTVGTDGLQRKRQCHNLQRIGQIVWDVREVHIVSLGILLIGRSKT